MTLRYKGNIKWYDNNKGYGIVIVNDDNREIFVHHSNLIKNGIHKMILQENDKLEFQIEYDENKQKYIATQITHFRQTKKRKNTESFIPNHNQSNMRILVGNHKLDKYQHDIFSRDVVLVPKFTNIENVYIKLLEEIKNSGIDENELWKLWHGDTHLIADDHCKWKSLCPTFNVIIEKIKDYFSIDIKATRFNLYRDSNDWKPFHHDAAAVKPDKAKTQNFTIGISFGLEREISFENAETKQTISFPLENDSLYAFSKDINIEWRHGIPQVSPENYSNEGRISIIIWGQVDIKNN